MFLATLDSKTKNNFKYNNVDKKGVKPYKINGIKTEKVMILQYSRQMDINKHYTLANSLPYFYYNDFAYTFFVNPNKGETNIDDGKYKFLQIIEFKVE